MISGAAADTIGDAEGFVQQQAIAIDQHHCCRSNTALAAKGINLCSYFTVLA